MDFHKEADSNYIKGKSEWSRNQEFKNKSEMSDSNICDPDDLKIKVEIELKEEGNGLVYEPDFYGHLQLVNSNQDIPTECNTIANIHSDIKKWNDTEHPLPTFEDSTANEEHNCTSHEYKYRQLKHSHDTYEEMFGAEGLNGKDLQSNVPAASEMFNYSAENSWQQQFPVTNQNCESYKHIDLVRSETAVNLAEKKRKYRMRIKEGNPELWCSMKQKEAYKKREQREERRHILREMHKTMGFISLSCNPSDLENHNVYLQALQIRYPEVWKQLKDALSVAEKRGKESKIGKNSRHLSKPVYLYKDVAEARKKYLYRQRMKQDRPEMYASWKERESCIRRTKRMKQKKDMIDLKNIKVGFLTSGKTKKIAAREQNDQNLYRHLENVSDDISQENDVQSNEDTAANSLQKSIAAASEGKSETEKKREYRRRIKEEDPSLLSASKQKDTNKKRKQRKEKRLVLHRMQRAMKQIAASSNSYEEENYKMYLQALQKKYPEIWKQLTEASSDADERHNEVLNDQNLQNSEKLLKPVHLNKDVAEAHKKYVARQKMELQSPEMDAKQTQGAQTRSRRRRMSKEADLSLE